MGRVNWLKEKFKNAIFRLRYPYVHKKLSKLNIESIEETVDRILKEKASISRFGDGEMMWLLKVNHGSFQSVSSDLSERLKEVLSANSGILIGLPDAFISVKKFKYRSGRIWRTELSKYGLDFYKVLDNHKKYSNANISRMYMDYKNYDRTAQLFKNLKKIWNDRNLLIVEGKTSRLGIGNDLFNNSKSIRRIICPSRNAFDKYDRILKETVSIATKIQNPLVLIALGPTATVLAFDLHQQGFQAIDIGHIDVEYEWFLMHAKHKTALPYKDVSEVQTNDPKMEFLNESYQREIITRI